MSKPIIKGPLDALGRLIVAGDVVAFSRKYNNSVDVTFRKISKVENGRVYTNNNRVANHDNMIVLNHLDRVAAIEIAGWDICSGDLNKQ